MLLVIRIIVGINISLRGLDHLKRREHLLNNPRFHLMHKCCIPYEIEASLCSIIFST